MNLRILRIQIHARPLGVDRQRFRRVHILKRAVLRSQRLLARTEAARIPRVGSAQFHVLVVDVDGVVEQVDLGIEFQVEGYGTGCARFGGVLGDFEVADCPGGAHDGRYGATIGGGKRVLDGVRDEVDLGVELAYDKDLVYLACRSTILRGTGERELYRSGARVGDAERFCQPKYNVGSDIEHSRLSCIHIITVPRLVDGEGVTPRIKHRLGPNTVAVPARKVCSTATVDLDGRIFVLRHIKVVQTACHVAIGHVGELKLDRMRCDCAISITRLVQVDDRPHRPSRLLRYLAATDFVVTWGAFGVGGAEFNGRKKRTPDEIDGVRRLASCAIARKGNS